MKKTNNRRAFELNKHTQVTTGNIHIDYRLNKYDWSVKSRHFHREVKSQLCGRKSGQRTTMGPSSPNERTRIWTAKGPNATTWGPPSANKAISTNVSSLKHARRRMAKAATKVSRQVKN